MLCCPCTAAIYRATFPTTALCKWIRERKRTEPLWAYCVKGWGNSWISQWFLLRDERFELFVFVSGLQKAVVHLLVNSVGYKRHQNTNDAVLCSQWKTEFKMMLTFYASWKSIYIENKFKGILLQYACVMQQEEDILQQGAFSHLKSSNFNFILERRSFQKNFHQ